MKQPFFDHQRLDPSLFILRQPPVRYPPPPQLGEAPCPFVVVNWSHPICIVLVHNNHENNSHPPFGPFEGGPRLHVLTPPKQTLWNVSVRKSPSTTTTTMTMMTKRTRRSERPSGHPLSGPPGTGYRRSDSRSFFNIFLLTSLVENKCLDVFVCRRCQIFQPLIISLCRWRHAE